MRKSAEAVEFEQWPAGIDFGLLRHLIGYAIRRAQLAIYRDFDASHIGLTPPQVAALVLVSANPGMNQTRLGRVMGVNRATIMALIDRLADQGLIRRTAAANDKRANAIALTKRGERCLADAVARVEAHDARISKRLSKKEIAQLRALLEKLG